MCLASRRLATNACLWLALTGLAPGGCALQDSLGPQGVRTPAPVDDVSAAISARDQRAEMQTEETQRLGREIYYLKELQGLDPEAVQGERERLEAAYAQHGRPVDRLRLAWVTAMGNSVGDLERAGQLLAGLPLEEPETATGVDSLAYILLNNISRRLSMARDKTRLRQALVAEQRRNKRLAQRVRIQGVQLATKVSELAALQEQIAALQALSRDLASQIDALTSIEKAISERKSSQ